LPAANGYGNGLDNTITGDSYGNRLEGADGQDSLSGSEGNDILAGGAGDDWLNGGNGSDTMIGGTGDDLFFVDVTTGVDVVIEESGAGTDTVVSTYGGRLAANVENLDMAYGTGIGNGLANEISGSEGFGPVTLLGRGGNDTLIGGGYADRLLGGGGDDALAGGSGYGGYGDTMIGGAGNDMYEVDGEWDRIVERSGEGNDTVSSWIDHSLGATFENLILKGDADLFGDGNDLANSITGNYGDNLLSAGGGNDTVLGGYGNDVIEGGAGDDAIDGGEGSDIMLGGEGNDVYAVNEMGDMTLEDAGEGTDKVVSLISWTLDDDVEDLELGGAEGIGGTGNALANTLTGNDGNNALNGKGGNDTMNGGNGDDTYIVNAADVINEAAGGGRDTVFSSAATYTLGAFVDDLFLTGGGNISGTGNTQGNFMGGNAGANGLSGLGGADTLVGGAGHDVLTGGGAADSFRYTGTLHADHSDTIADFTHLIDRIDLNASTFEGLLVGDLATGKFKAAIDITGAGAGATVDATDRILYDSDSGKVYYDSNGNGEGGRTLIFTLTANPQLTFEDIHIFSEG
jgi:trimeric autotransporter adhesin